MEREDYLQLVALAAVWGASFLFIKIAVNDMPPVVVVFLRNASAALALLLYLRVTGTSLRDAWRRWRPGLVIGLFNAALPYTLIATGEQHIDSSLAGILNATAPLWTALMAPLFREADAIRPRQLLGLGMGFAGVVVLARPGGNLLNASFLGMLAVVAATFCYALATHYSKRHFQDVPPQVPAFLQCVVAAAVLAPFALVGHPSHLPSTGALAATIWLGVGATAAAMVVSFRLIQRVGASRTIVVTYLIPPSALLWGALFLHERPTPVVFLALALILGGVFFITRRPARRGRMVEPDTGILDG